MPHTIRYSSQRLVLHGAHNSLTSSARNSSHGREANKGLRVSMGAPLAKCALRKALRVKGTDAAR